MTAGVPDGPLFSVIVVVAFALVTQGSVATSTAPVEISADGGLVVDVRARTGWAKGNVVIRQKGLAICCDRAGARLDRGRITRISCEGRVLIRRADAQIVAQRAVFDAVRRRLELSGGVRVWREDGELAGDTVTYDLVAERVQVAGRPSVLRLRPTARPVPPRRCPAP